MIYDGACVRACLRGRAGGWVSMSVCVRGGDRMSVIEQRALRACVRKLRAFVRSCVCVCELRALVCVCELRAPCACMRVRIAIERARVVRRSSR